MSLGEVRKRLPDGIPLLDPIKEMGIDDENFRKNLDRAEELSQRLASHRLMTEFSEEERIALIQAYERKTDLLRQSKALRDEARGCQTIAMKDDLRKMKRVLKKLGHVDANGVIQTKGRTACEINTANELVVVELIFTGVFKSLSPEQCVALLSAMIFDDRNNDDDDPLKGVKSFLRGPFYKLQDVARTVAKVQIGCNIEMDEEEFVNSFNPGMMEAVFAWCKGVKFIEVQKLTSTFEGTTIRTLRRLEELVRQISTAAKAIGDRELEETFDKGNQLIKRDIVFCSSLYL